MEGHHHCERKQAKQAPGQASNVSKVCGKLRIDVLRMTGTIRCRSNQREGSNMLHDASERTYAPGTMVVRSDARALGAVTALTHKAHQSSWEVPGRPGTLRAATIGVATDCPNTPADILARLEKDGHPSVTVIHPDGTREIRDVASFRKPRETTRIARAMTEAAKVPETAKEKFGTHSDLVEF